MDLDITARSWVCPPGRDMDQLDASVPRTMHSGSLHHLGIQARPGLASQATQNDVFPCLAHIDHPHKTLMTASCRRACIHSTGTLI